MAKYIDAAAFAGGTLTSSESQLRFREMTGQEAYFEFLRMVNDAPAADVAPVVHGQWEPCFEDWRKQIEGDKCSACGFEHYGCSIRNYHYCPNCGARMDLGGDGNA